MIEDFKIDPLVLGKDPKETKVVVAMSGGVDSSVVAALLHVLGYQVIGVTMKLYDSLTYNGKQKSCCGVLDVHDAKRVADLMGFSHYVLDYKDVFKEEVIDDFINSYSSGNTPIPCIKCNQTVKFRDLLGAAKNLGSDVLVTGHYVRRFEENGEIFIYSSEDKVKDQSYFLFATTLEQLKFLRFPLGAFSKDKVRELGRYFGLQVSDKPDSQDICFVSKSYRDTIVRLRPRVMNKGRIVHIDGSVLGEHEGIVNFTIGQRRGIGISKAVPLYVVKINVDENEVIVGPKESLFQSELKIQNLNWISHDHIPKSGIEVTVKLRSSHIGSKALIYADVEGQDTALVVLENSYCAISPGQACVIYDDKRMLGGGWIYR